MENGQISKLKKKKRFLNIDSKYTRTYILFLVLFSTQMSQGTLEKWLISRPRARKEQDDPGSAYYDIKF